MRRWAPLLFIVGLTSACANTPARIESKALANAPLESPDRFIIAAVDNHSVEVMARAGSTPRGYDAIAAYGPSPSAQQVMRSLERDYGLREVSAWPIEPLHIHCAVLKLPDGTDRSAMLATLSRDRRVKLAQPLQTFATRTDEYNDPYVGLQRGFQLMDVAEAHPLSQGDGVKVAIIDTGADTGHPDLSPSIAAAENFVDSDARQFRGDRHGTEVAGVIAAVANNHQGIVGIAPGARLLVYKACWQASADADAAHCNSFTLARALVAALDAHAQVINLSLAGPEDPLLSDLIREGLRRGVLFVGAAASEAPDGKLGLLHQAGVIEVASSESASAPASAVYAPGREILTLLPGGHYDFASGDSIATAQVTGVVALLLERNHGLSAAAVYQILRNTSAHSGEAPSATEHVDACAAVVAIVGRGSCKAFGPDHRLAGKQTGSDELH
jgi:subtilisin family serine protease